MHHMYGYGSIWPMIIMTIFWAGLIGLGIYLIINYINGSHKQTEDDKPLQILQERLARGEIDVEEYERLRAILKEDRR